ncbi:MAG: prepilin peptidase [Nitrospirae bacterium]|nr:MAG: prepilin peptidase [Nitrospirota bacterium]
MDGLTIAAATGLGLIVGSFLNVCIHRLPRRESVVSPPSHCPACGRRIRPWDNVPVLAWLWLRGRCRDCGARISIRYPLVEAANGGLWGIVAWTYGPTLEAVAVACFLSALLVVTLIDLDHQIIPDRITLPGIPLAWLVAVGLGRLTWLDATLGAAIPAGLFLAVVYLSRGGMGLGDVKLVAMIGAFLGWRLALLTILLAAVSGSLVGVAMMLFLGKGRKTAVPFGPFLALGAVASLAWGEAILRWYLGLGRGL